MPANQKAPGAFMFAGKCCLNTLITKGGYGLHAFRGNVVVWQEALSALPRISQEKSQHPPQNFAGKFSIARAVT